MEPDPFSMTISQLVSKRNQIRKELSDIERSIIVLQSNCKHKNVKSFDIGFDSNERFECPDCLKVWYD